MAGNLRGDPINAVLIEPQVKRFEELTGLDADDLDVDVTGWNKRVLIGDDRVFLFPRAGDALDWFERELATYEALAATDLAIVPRLLQRYDEPTVHPLPFAAVTRLRGAVPEDPTVLFGQLGAAVAQWHSLDPAVVAGHLRDVRPPRHHDVAHVRWLRQALDPRASAAAASMAAARLERPQHAARWRELLARASAMVPVLVHGDIHENQLLATDGKLTGVLDWETARIDHPFWDFDLGEWGTGLWRDHRQEFRVLRSQAWRAYASARGLDEDPAPLEAAFRIAQSLYLRDGGGDPDVVGTLQDELASLDDV